MTIISSVSSKKEPFGFGVNLEGFTQIKDMDQLLAIDPKNNENGMDEILNAFYSYSSIQ